MASTPFKDEGVLEAADLYVKRVADEELPRELEAGQLCFVLAPRKIGKSSLRIRTVQRLEAGSIRCAVVDLTGIGGGTEEQWLLSLTDVIADALKLSTDPIQYWNEHLSFTFILRWRRFLTEVVLREVAGPVVLFFDEIDTARTLTFSTDPFFASIRELVNARAGDSRLKRLTFCLLGVAAPSDLIRDSRMTPFNLGHSIALNDFTREEAELFRPALAQIGDPEGLLLDPVFAWTDGNPYAMQRLFKALSMEQGSGLGPLHARVDRLVDELFIQPDRTRDDTHDQAELRFRDALQGEHAPAVLSLYRRLLSGETVLVDHENPAQTVLQLAGLAGERPGDSRPVLRIRNRIIRMVFDEQWLRQLQAGRQLDERLSGWLAHGRDFAFLLRGAELEEALEWSKRRTDVSPEERDFLIASMEEAKRHESLQREAEKSRTLRNRILLMSLFIAVVLVLLGVVAVLWKREVLLKEQAQAAEAASLEAEAEAQMAGVELEAALEDARNAGANANISAETAEQAWHEAQSARSRAEERSLEAEMERERAEVEARRARNAESKARAEEDRANTALEIAVQAQRTADQARAAAEAAQQREADLAEKRGDLLAVTERFARLKAERDNLKLRLDQMATDSRAGELSQVSARIKEVATELIGLHDRYRVPCLDLPAACPPDFACTTQGTCLDRHRAQVFVPGGYFLQGCLPSRDRDCDPDEWPAHLEKVGDFAIDEQEVTVAQYLECVATNKCTMPKKMPTGCNLASPEKLASHPVNCLSWNESRAYCEWRKMRLPTEAEWEKTARGVDGRIYPWGDERPQHSLAWYGKYETRRTDDSAGASPFGALDMAGNVAEWVADEYAPDAYRSASARTVAASLAPPLPGKVVRGGSAYDRSGRSLRVSNRTVRMPNVASPEIGFRCVRDVSAGSILNSALETRRSGDESGP